MKELRTACVAALLFFSFVSLGEAQSIYFDTDGDGVSSASDHLNPTGETLVTVYLDTCHDRDGRFQGCNARSRSGSSEGLLDFFSYDLILKLQPKSGSVRWSEFKDGVGFVANHEDRRSSSELLVSRQGEVALAPGRHQLGQISITTIAGTPVLQIGKDSKLDPAAFTGFGTHCSGSEYPNSYVLGTDWFDAGSTTITTEVGPTSVGLSIGPPSRDPHNPGTAITLSLPAPARVRLAIYDVGGRLVRTIAETSNMAAGKRTLIWDGRTTAGQIAASGIYFVRFDAGSSKLTRRLVLVK